MCIPSHSTSNKEEGKLNKNLTPKTSNVAHVILPKIISVCISSPLKLKIKAVGLKGRNKVVCFFLVEGEGREQK